MTEQTSPLSRRGFLSGLITLPVAAAALSLATPAEAQGGLDPADRERFKRQREARRQREHALKKKKFITRRRRTNRGVFSRRHNRFGSHSFKRFKKKRGFFIGRGR